MAARKYPRPDPRTLGDLTITIWPRDFVTYEGPIELMRRDGLIPRQIDLPSGDANKRWDADGWRFLLRRCRPPNHKGSKKSWVDGNWWWLRVDRAGRSSLAASSEHRLSEARRVYDDELFRQSPAGQRAWRRYWSAQEDRPFQRFINRTLQPLC